MDTAAVARQILREETAMRERIAGLWDRGVEASLAEKTADDLGEEVVKYLADAHAIEEQAIQMLEAAPRIVGDWPELDAIFADHLVETRRQEELVDQRLEALGGGSNWLKDAAMRLGAINWGTFFKAHPDTPGKLVAFAYAFEHLEIGGYELLKRTAQRAGDTETAAVAEQILPEERAAAQRLRGAFDRAVDASLQEVGAA
jgi:ferritin-like metal-binding protein YciE